MVIDTQQSESPTASSRVGLRWGPETLEVRDQEVFGTGDPDLCRRFLHRVFSVDEVKSVQIDRRRSIAVIRYERAAGGLAELLQRLAMAIRGTREIGPEPSVFGLLPRDLSQAKWTVYRHRGILTTWRVVGDQPGILILRHDVMMTNPEMTRRVVHQIESMHGVLSSRIRPLTGTLRIRFDPALTRAERLLRAIESAPESLPVETALGEQLPPVKFALANTALAVSLVTDFVLPAAWPAAGAILVGSNLGIFRQAATQLGGGMIGLPVLYTSIAAATLTTGQFLPWAAMSWMTRFWKERYQHQLSTAGRRLMGEIIQQQRFARLEAAGGTEVEVPVDRLSAGDLILVSAGEKISVDGRVVRGHALVDERMIRGSAGLSRRSPDDEIYAGSFVVAGNLQVETHHQGAKTRASTLARAAMAATVQQPGDLTISREGEKFASRIVAPTLATAGLGLYLGGAPTALAIMRADYASGPGLAFPLETLQALAICYQQGIVVRDLAALEKLAKADVLLLDDHPALEATEAEVASVRVFPGHTEYQVLRYAASAFRGLDDERSKALGNACLARKIALLDSVSIECGRDITLHADDQVIKVGNLGGEGPTGAADAAPGTSLHERPIDSLMVGINGQIAGLIDFRRTSRLLAASALQELRAKPGQALAIGLVSAADDARLQSLAATLGADFYKGGLSGSDLVQLIRGCRKRGLKVAYAGECLARPRVAREADVSISLDADALDELDRNPAPIVLLQPDLSKLAVLREATRIYNRRVKVAQGSALIPNFFCVAGAFLLGFTSLATVIVTNLGTYSTYARTTASIRGLERRLAKSSTFRKARTTSG